MKSILIVDDEPIIVQGLLNVVHDMEGELQAWKAHTAKEALQVMERHRIDILITDIQMPGMTGLQLSEIVCRQWRHCKIIFLSGYSDQEYLQSALRQGAFDYLIKPADNETIVDLIGRASAQIDQETDNLQIMEKARHQYKEALHLLREDFFSKLISGRVEEGPALQEQLDALELPFNRHDSLVLVIARIDRWPLHFTGKDRMLLSYAVENIMEHHLAEKCRIYSMKRDSYIVWFIQHRKDDGTLRDNRLGLHGYVSEMLEKVQQDIRIVLHLSLSLVLSKPDVSWQTAGQAYSAMYALLQRGIGLDEEIIIDDTDVIRDAASDPSHEQAALSRHIEQLRTKLENNDISAFYDQLKEVFDLVRKSVYVSYTGQMEIFNTVSAMLLSYINRRKLSDLLAKEIDFSGLGNYRMHANWEELLRYYLDIAWRIRMLLESEKEDIKTRIVSEIDSYIHSNLSGDLSLHHLAARVHLSPHYLSRIYHATSGSLLAEKIASIKIAKAKEMLTSGDVKIQTVAAELGFDNNLSYFSKFFKKWVGVTPVEYKELSRKRKLDLREES
ncbi:response regulator [Paenibacillus sp. MBLB4367]|uniref:response regulator transcription factor n=1 Tax=Paenibacillus sp. MBLB4367 TaxID=3384767 RepID=UPI003907F86B